MPRSILEIDVADEKFKAFLALYQKYQDELKKLPQFWQGATAAIEDAADATDKVADATDRVVDATDRVVDANGKVVETTEAAGKSAASMNEVVAAIGASTALIVEGMVATAGATERADHAMKSTAGHAKSIASSIAHTTVNLAKWATLSLGAGLIGGGVGLFGLDALAGAVSGQRKSALGLGITTGEQQAFDVNFGSRLVGSDFLSGVQGVKSDLAQQWQFAALGIPMSEVQGDDTAQLGIDVIQRARTLWQQAGPGGHNTQWMQAHGLGGFMDYATWQRIGQASPAEMAQYQAQYQRDAQTMGAPNQTQIDWQNFSVQMKRAADQIESVFVRGLDPLIPALTKLSTSVTTALGDFLSNPHLKDWIADLGRAIETLGTYIGSDKFRSDIKAFVDDIGYAAEKLGNDLRFFGLLPPLPPPDAPNNAGRSDLPKVDEHHGIIQKLFNPGGGWDFSGIEKANNLPTGLLAAIGTQESGLTVAPRDSVKNDKHYQGMFQLGPEVQHDYGVTNPYDPNQNANAAGMELRDLVARYHGNIAEAVGAHDWGSGNVDKDIAAHGKDWLNYAPRETQNMVANVAHRLHVEVSVLNQTGANIAIAANATRQ